MMRSKEFTSDNELTSKSVLSFNFKSLTTLEKRTTSVYGVTMLSWKRLLCRNGATKVPWKRQKQVNFGQGSALRTVKRERGKCSEGVMPEFDWGI